MLTAIITAAFGFFGAAVGTGLYLTGKKAGKAQAEKEQLESMRASLFKSDSLLELIPMVLLAGLFSGCPKTPMPPMPSRVPMPPMPSFFTGNGNKTETES